MCACCLAETAGNEAPLGHLDVEEPHLEVFGALPSLPVKAEVYHMGHYIYQGVIEPTDVCQFLPASLSEGICQLACQSAEHNTTKPLLSSQMARWCL